MPTDDVRTSRLRRSVEILVALTWGVAGIAKLVVPQASGLGVLAQRLGLPTAALEHVHRAAAVMELVVAVAIIAGVRVRWALWASYGLAFMALAAWISSDALRAGCGCFGRITLSPAQRLGVILFLLIGSGWAVWGRLSQRGCGSGALG